MGGRTSVIASLNGMAHEAHRAFPKLPGREGLLALMDFQVARLLATDIQVRRSGSEPRVSGNGTRAFTPMPVISCEAAVPGWEACVNAHPVNCPCARSVCVLRHEMQQISRRFRACRT